MQNRFIDLYSDTKSKPTPGMRKAMAEAEVGDEQKFEDPTVNRLRETVCTLLGKEDAVFLPATHDVIKGPAGVEKFFAGLFGMGVKGHRLELIEAHGEGNLIVAAAKWSATGKDAAGMDQPWGGVATHVFAKQPDGSLKLWLHTFN